MIMVRDLIKRRGECIHCGLVMETAYTEKQDNNRFFFGTKVLCPCCGFDVCMKKV